MALDIWNLCEAQKHIKKINETAWRIVELQEKTSLRKLVDSIDEQKVLEELLEESKPSVSSFSANFHPLLYTPFRYPPLKYGSRFGKKTEPSLWYGSLSIKTALSEKAYYQFIFLEASDADFELITVPLTIFSVKLKIKEGLKLNEEPFVIYKNNISSPTNYEASQLLGAKMRANKLKGFTFHSARDHADGINVGLFDIGAFADKNPETESIQIWQCNLTKTNIEFVKIGPVQESNYTFPINTFLIDGELPSPAVA